MKASRKSNFNQSWLPDPKKQRKKEIKRSTIKIAHPIDKSSILAFRLWYLPRHKRNTKRYKRQKIWITIKYAKYTNSKYKKHIKTFSMATKKIFKLQARKEIFRFGPNKKKSGRKKLLNWMTFYTLQREGTERKILKFEVARKKKRDLNKIFILLLSENIVAVVVF